jgi:hypothetical protein
MTCSIKSITKPKENEQRTESDNSQNMDKL